MTADDSATPAPEAPLFTDRELLRLEFVRQSRFRGYAQFSEYSRSDDPTFDNRWLNQWPFKDAA